MSTNPVPLGCARPHSCSAEVRLEAMARSPLTRELSPDERGDLDRHVTAWSWAKDDPIVLAGDEISGSFMVVSGRARVTRDTADGREITVDIAAPGDVVGPLHTEPTPSADSAWAMETTCALHLPADALACVIEDHPLLALSIIRMQQERLTRSRERDIGQTARTVEQRVGSVLLNLAGKLGRTRPDGSTLLEVRLRRDDIAGMAATTVESTSRAMAKMKREGTIDSGREWVAVLDRAALDRLIDIC